MTDAKVYVNVVARFRKDGFLVPLTVQWEDGRVFQIDKVLSVCRSASLKAGGAGTRYTCRILGSVTNLFLENGRWFVERKHEKCGTF